MPILKNLAIALLYFLLLILILLLARRIIINHRTADKISVYDLTWPDSDPNNNVTFHKWRYFLKPKSYLPFKIEKYCKTAGDPNESYKLTETLTIEYPTERQMSQMIDHLLKPNK